MLQKNKDSQNKSAENILLQQNHRSKNIIICQKITNKANKTVTHHLK
jgi:hypothetical protein